MKRKRNSDLYGDFAEEIIKGQNCITNSMGFLCIPSTLRNLKNDLLSQINLIDQTLSFYQKNPYIIDSFNSKRKEEVNKRLSMFADKVLSDYRDSLDQSKIVSERNRVHKSYVYLMYDPSNDCYKIGYSINPEKRRASLNCLSPGIKLICTKDADMKIERHLHKKYMKYRYLGEWFKFPNDILKEVIEEFNSIDFKSK